jgi:hypothetical protein
MCQKHFFMSGSLERKITKMNVEANQQIFLYKEPKNKIGSDVKVFTKQTRFKKQTKTG